MKGLAEVLACSPRCYPATRGHHSATCEASRDRVVTLVDNLLRERLAGARDDVARHFRFEGLLYATHTDRWLDDEWQQRLANTLADAALAAVAEALGVGEVRG